MIKYTLNGRWIMTDDRGIGTDGTIPGSVYSFLLNAQLMKNPYVSDNEPEALKLMESDYTFSRSFVSPQELMDCKNRVLRFDGIDTLSDVYLNGQLLGSTDNMHVAWEFNVRDVLREGRNELKVCTKSPTRFIAKMDREDHLGGSLEAMRGFPHLRKAHCMFGWDWGPRLPDQGIWKDVMLLGWNGSRIENVKVTQRHTVEEGHAADMGWTHVSVRVDVERSAQESVLIDLESPDGQKWSFKEGVFFDIPDPQLWWPNGLGDQPLYTVRVRSEDGTDSVTKRIGLRTLTVQRRPDEWGESFAFEVNGQTFFSMGADYIPEDCILSRMSRDRTEKLLRSCVDSHFNVIRVWGGGIYPFDWFYDLCDELGLVVWQDLMFSCANYRLTDRFVDSIRTEIRQNVRRLRHHASLGLWCGNNEMEQFALECEFDGDEKTAADYLIQNEFIIPEILAKEDPETFYWPSSPSSGGKFDFPQDPNRGDVHDWSVWHGGVPFTAYRSHFYRFLSEFGFQSFPCMETVRSFTKAEDRNIFSYVMEMHQRNAGANGKILQYLSATFLYPTDFDTLLYASQLLAAEALRYGVEHFRRNRSHDRCMGTVYWQLNDIWPGASWSSIDYFGRWKALQYYAARFFAPVMISCEEESMVSLGRTCISEPEEVLCRARLCITNETWETVTDIAEWELRGPGSEVIKKGEFPVKVEPFSSEWLDTMDFSDYNPRWIHLCFRLRKSGSFGTTLFVSPKHYRFADPKLEIVTDSATGLVTVTAQAFAKSIEIYDPDGYVRLNDNYFDMEKGSRTLALLEGKAGHLIARSIFDIR